MGKIESLKDILDHLCRIISLNPAKIPEYFFCQGCGSDITFREIYVTAKSGTYCTEAACLDVAAAEDRLDKPDSSRFYRARNVQELMESGEISRFRTR